MAKKKRTEEEILEEIRNYKPKMTEGMSRREFYARLGTHNYFYDKDIIKGDGTNDTNDRNTD
jgi:hypothetical protein